MPTKSESPVLRRGAGHHRVSILPAGRLEVAERFVVPRKPGNAGGGKGPQFKTDAIRGEGPGDWETYQLHKCSEAADGVARESVKLFATAVTAFPGQETFR